MGEAEEKQARHQDHHQASRQPASLWRKEEKRGTAYQSRAHSDQREKTPGKLEILEKRQSFPEEQGGMAGEKGRQQEHNQKEREQQTGSTRSRTDAPDEQQRSAHQQEMYWADGKAHLVPWPGQG